MAFLFRRTSGEEPAALKERCVRGDARAWQGLYRYAWAVGQRSFRLPKDDCDDIAQDALLALTQRLHGVNDVKAFVGRVAHNKCVDRINAARREQARNLSDMPSGGEGADPVEPQRLPERIVDSEVLQQLRGVIAEMKDRCRRLLTARFLDELPYEQAGKDVGLPADQARVNLARCLKRLRDLMARKRPQMFQELMELGGDIRL